MKAKKERNKKIVEMYNKEPNITKIARIFELSRTRVYQILMAEKSYPQKKA